MPLKSVDAEVFYRFRGVKIYHVYKNDDVEDICRDYLFSTVSWSQDDSEYTFDIRDIPRFGAIKRRKGEDSDDKALLRLAISEGWLKQDEIPDFPDGAIV